MARQQRRAATRRHPSYLPWAIAGGVILAFVAMLVALARQPRERLPGTTDHWHARLMIEACGATLPPLPPSPGDVHTHGDGVIHVHPSGAATTGRRANLRAFFGSVGGRLTPTTLSLPGGRVYTTGQTCPDGKTARLRVLVRHAGAERFIEISDGPGYVPQDRDEIRVVFAS